jgi:hypothetical protein
MTKFSLVFVLMVQSLHSVMSPFTLRFFRAALSFCKLAKLWSVKILLAATVSKGMVIVTTFMVMSY